MYTPQLEQIIAKATAMRVDERFQTAAEMRAALLTSLGVAQTGPRLQLL